MRLCALVLALLAGALAPRALPQAAAAQRLDAVDHAERQRRIALTGDLGLPALPPVLASSPRDTLLYADRFPAPGLQEAQEGTPPTMFDGFLNGTETGTGKNEIFKYQLGNSYDGNGPPHPLVVAYHGFGSSAGSVAAQSTIDEECDERAWVYLAPTGIDDQLFGSPISQQNTAAAIQWMLDNFNLDPDRIYMVGFSMGGGVVASFAARHRDPDGLMVAALGTVSGTYDWTMAWHIGTPQMQTILQNAFNFGGTPAAFPFPYQQASDLHFAPGTYPPLPGSLNVPLSMVNNLGSTPAFMTWDSGDTLPEVLAQNPVMQGQLQALDTTLQVSVVSGTTEPHSWAVLDEEALFDFLGGKVVERAPETFAGQLDLDGQVSFTTLTQRVAGSFTYVLGEAFSQGAGVAIEGVVNASEVLLDGALAQIVDAGPVVLEASSSDAAGFRLRLQGFAEPPAYLLDGSSGDLVTGVDSDPVADALLVDVPGNTALDVDLVLDPSWTADLWTTPEPVGIGDPLTLTLDAPSTSTASWLVVGFDEALTTIKGAHKITVSPAPPSFLIGLGLDANGDVSVPTTMPNDPLLVGVRLLLQAVPVDGTFHVDAVSNMWALDVE